MDKEGRVKYQEVYEIGMKVWQHGYVTVNDGSISVRSSDNTVLCTPTGISKGALVPEMICKVRLGGSTISENPPYKASSEVKAHLRFCQKDSEVSAVVHTYPIYAAAFAIDRKELVNKQMPENVLAMPVIPVASYAIPSAMQLAEDIAPFVRGYTGCLMEMYGALSRGGPLLAAYQDVERLGYTTQLIYLCEQLGFKSRRLPEDGIQKLISMRS